MNILISETDVINFSNKNKIPLLFVFDHTKIPSEDNIPTVVCFEKDKEALVMVLPVMYAIKTMPNQIEYTNDRLQIEYNGFLTEV